MVVPAIIPQSSVHLRESLESLREVTNTFQVDIVDGDFVPFTSWPYHEGETIEDGAHIYEGYDIELDLMVRNPELTLKKWLSTGVKRVVIHVESTDDVPGCIAILKEERKTVGLSLLNDTDLAVLDPYLHDIDFVQCMGIKEIGMQGNTFDERVLERIRAIKSAHPELEVSVDGSVNQETITMIAKAGATRLVSGSAIYRTDNPVAAFNTLSALVS